MNDTNKADTITLNIKQGKLIVYHETFENLNNIWNLTGEAEGISVTAHDEKLNITLESGASGGHKMFHLIGIRPLPKFTLTFKIQLVDIGVNNWPELGLEMGNIGFYFGRGYCYTTNGTNSPIYGYSSYSEVDITMDVNSMNMTYNLTINNERKQTYWKFNRQIENCLFSDLKFRIHTNYAPCTYHVWSLEQLTDRNMITAISGNSVGYIFDDGHISNFNFKEITEKYGFTVTYGVIVENVGKDMRFDWNQAKILIENGSEIASHSLNHSGLLNLNFKNAKNDILLSKRFIEENITEYICKTYVPANSQVNNTLAMFMQNTGLYCANTYLGHATRYGFQEGDIFPYSNLNESMLYWHSPVFMLHGIFNNAKDYNINIEHYKYATERYYQNDCKVMSFIKWLKEKYNQVEARYSNINFLTSKYEFKVHTNGYDAYVNVHDTNSLYDPEGTFVLDSNGVLVKHWYNSLNNGIEFYVSNDTSYTIANTMNEHGRESIKFRLPGYNRTEVVDIIFPFDWINNISRIMVYNDSSSQNVTLTMGKITFKAQAGNEYIVTRTDNEDEKHNDKNSTDTPGYEILTLFIAVGVALILLKHRRCL